VLDQGFAEFLARRKVRKAVAEADQSLTAQIRAVDDRLTLTADTVTRLQLDLPTGACWVEIKSVWTRKHLVEKICHALGIPVGRTVADSVENIGEELSKSGRPLLLDEAHILCTDGMMKLLHDIYESSLGSPIVLIGEEMLPQSLARWERVHNRILVWEPAQPADLREVGILAQLKCPELQISEEVLTKVLVESQAVARRIVTNLHQIKDYARTEGKAEITAADVPNIRWQIGKAPSPRGGM
jgi:hypothetical protein